MGAEASKQSAYVPLFVTDGERHTKQTAYLPIFDVFSRFSQQTAYIAYYLPPPSTRRRQRPIVNG